MRTRCLVGFALILLAMTLMSEGTAQTPGQGPGKKGPGGFGGPGGFMPQPGQIMPPFLQQMLKLTDEQKKQTDQLQKEVDAKLEKILTEAQRKQLKEMRERMGSPGGFPKKGPGENPKVGDAAPDFTVKDVDGKKTVKLSDLKGKPVVLIFGSCT